MKELQKKYAKHGFEIIGVANDEPETLTEFFEKKGELPWLNIVDSDASICERLKIEAFPTYMLIDQQGRHFATPWEKAEIEKLVVEKLGLEKAGDEKSSAALEQVDPGKDFAPFPGFVKPTDDAMIVEALMARRDELLAESPGAWKGFDTGKAPAQTDSVPPASSEATVNSVEGLIKSTVILIGGRDKKSSWTAGGVILSEDGLMATNYHVAKNGSPMIAMTSEGKVYRVTSVVAARKPGDVALLQLEDAEGLAFASLAPEAPRTGDEIEMIHHSEERFFTYDRGHIRRYSLMEDATYMEISGEYAVGGSGCGIFNSDYELVGLASFISYGSESDNESAAGLDSEAEESGEAFNDYVILVRLASSWQSLRSLWN